MGDGTPSGPESAEERRKRIQREKSARHRARKRGEDIPLRVSGPKRNVDPSRPKRCRDCGEEKSPSEFFLVKAPRNPRLHSYCKECCARRGRAHRDANPGQNRDRLHRRYWADPEESRRQARQRRIDNPERYRAYDRSRREQARTAKLAREYGLTPEHYDMLLQNQGGVCAICGRADENGNQLAVDHCHDTGAVRGLLCLRCNSALGYLRDDLAVVRSAARYLEHPPATPLLKMLE